VIALVERELDDAPNMLTIASSQSQATTDRTVVTVRDAKRSPANRCVAATSRTRRRSSRCSTVRVWQLLNSQANAPDPPPSRPVPDPFATPIRYEIPKSASETRAQRAITLERTRTTPRPRNDDNERASRTHPREPNEIVELAVRFTTTAAATCTTATSSSTRMRHDASFVTMPSELMPFMA